MTRRDPADLLRGVLAGPDRSRLEDLVPERPPTELLVAFVEGLLTPAAQEQIERYLARHPEARARVAGLRAMLSGAPAVVPRPAPLRAILRRGRWVAAAALLVVLLGLWLWSRRNPGCRAVADWAALVASAHDAAPEELRPFLAPVPSYRGPVGRLRIHQTAPRGTVRTSRPVFRWEDRRDPPGTPIRDLVVLDHTGGQLWSVAGEVRAPVPCPQELVKGSYQWRLGSEDAVHFVIAAPDTLARVERDLALLDRLREQYPWDADHHAVLRAGLLARGEYGLFAEALAELGPGPARTRMHAQLWEYLSEELDLPPDAR